MTGVVTPVLNADWVQQKLSLFAEDLMIRVEAAHLKSRILTLSEPARRQTMEAGGLAST